MDGGSYCRNLGSGLGGFLSFVLGSTGLENK